jgi:rhodanese-related sulfurtransferase
LQEVVNIKSSGVIVQASKLAKRLKSKDAPTIIDVRSGIEFKQGHIPGAIHSSLEDFAANGALAEGQEYRTRGHL